MSPQLLLSGLFVTVFVIVAGAYALFVVFPERRTRHVLEKRMVASKPGRLALVSVAEEVRRLSAVASINALLTRQNALVAPLQRLIEQSALPITVGTLLLASAVLASATHLLVTRATQATALALVLGAMAGAVPYIVVRHAATRRIDKFEELFPEALDLITRALKAGHAFTTGLSMVGDEMPDPVGTEFRLLYERQNFGAPIDQALRTFAERVPLLDARFFVTAVLTQRESGGNLSEVLQNLASVIRERFRVKREVRVKSAHGRMTGWVLAGVPPSMALAMFITSPNVMRSLVTDPLGARMIMAGVVLQVVGTLIIRKLVRIDY